MQRYFSWISFQASIRPYLRPVLWICIGFNADPDPGFVPNADPYPGSLTYADPDPDQTLPSQRMEFCPTKLLFCVGDFFIGHKTDRRRYGACIRVFDSLTFMFIC